MTNPEQSDSSEDRKQLVQFGLVVGGIIALLFGVLLPWIFEAKIPIWPWVVGIVMATLALVQPSWLAMPYKWWMRFGELLHKIMSPLIMGLLFFVVIMPFGLVRRMITRDPLKLRIDKDIDTYRSVSDSLSDSKEPF